jgi:hypothetical protein
MKTERVLGFILLLVGIAVVGYTLIASFQIFTGKTIPPQVFSEVMQAQPSSQVFKGQVGSLEAIQGQIENAVGAQLKAFIPKGAIPRALNLFAWSLLAGIMILGGSKIAGLGVRLLKSEK